MNKNTIKNQADKINFILRELGIMVFEIDKESSPVRYEKMKATLKSFDVSKTMRHHKSARHLRMRTLGEINNKKIIS